MFGRAKSFIVAVALVLSATFAVAQGVKPDAGLLPVHVATTGNITLSGAQTIDGVSATAGVRVLVKDQTTASQNGVYTVAAGAWTRVNDFRQPAQGVQGSTIYVVNGDVHGGQILTITNSNPIVPGTTGLTFAPYGQYVRTVAAGEVSYFARTNKTVRTGGYYTEGDGGGAQYVRVASEPAWGRGKFRSVDRFLPDGNVSAGNGGWWQLADLGTINFLQLGAKEGNDSANVADNSAASAAWYAIATAEGRGELRLPAGIFRVAWMSSANPGSAFLMADNTSLRGVGAGATFIQMDNVLGTNGVRAVKPGANGSGYPGSRTFTDVPLTTLTGSGSGARATITTGGGGAVSGVTITYPGSGYVVGDTMGVDNVYTEGQGSGFVRQVEDLTNPNGVIAASGVANTTVSDLSVDGDRLNISSGQTCVRGGDDGVTTFRISRLNISNCQTYGIGIQGDIGTGANNGVWITDVNIDTTGYDGMDLKNKAPAGGGTPNNGIFVSNVLVKNHGADEVATRDVAGVDCRGPCRLSNITIRDIATPTVNMNRVGIRLRPDGSAIDQVGSEYASLTGFNITASTTAGAGSITGVEIHGDYTQVANGTVTGGTQAFRVRANYVNMANLTAHDYTSRGWWYTNAPNYTSDYTTCVNCKALQTTLGTAVGFYFSNGTHASAELTGHTLINPVMLNNAIGIEIDTDPLGTRILSPQFINNTANITDSSTSSSNPTVRSWDLVTQNATSSATASGGTLNLDRTDGDTVEVGAGNISAITLAPGRSRMLRFTATPTITGGVSLGIPTSAATIVAEVGDRALVRGYAAGVVRIMWYQRNSGIPLDPDLAALTALNSNGMIARTATDTWAARTLTGTANEIDFANGSGVAGNPTASLPSALTFTGKTVTNGTFNTPTIATPTVTNGTFATPSLTTPTSSGGTFTSPALTTPTITSGTLATNLINGVITVPCTTTQATHTGNLTETVVASATIPANTVGANGSIRAVMLGSRVSGAAGTITFRIRFGANNTVAGSTLFVSSAIATGDAQTSQRMQLVNRNSASSQIGNNIGTTGGWGISTAALATSAINTANQSFVNFTVTLGNATDTGAIEYCVVEILARN